MTSQAAPPGTDFDPIATQLRFAPANRALLEAICRQDFASFIHRSFNALTPGQALAMNWHIQALAYHLEQVRCGKLRRLIVNMPPRSLKSLISSVSWPAFVLGHDPTKRLIVASYASELSIKHANDFRALLSADWYRSLFPSTRISRVKNTEIEVATTRQGFRLATSVDGTLTGRGGDVIIIDDPLKPIDALSDSKRERVNEWYNNTLLSRLDDKREGAIIVVAQRLHIDDLSGVLSRASDEWTVLNFPAIAEENRRIQIGEGRFHTWRAGEVLQPQREPREVLDKIREQLGSDTFNAQYLQQPIPPGGALIKRNWLKRYTHLPKCAWPSYIVQSWDTASKPGESNDYTVSTTWLVHEGSYYLIDVLRARFDYPDLRSRAIAYAKAHKPKKVLIEDAGVGTALIAELRRAGLTAIGIKPEHNKTTRLAVEAAKFEAGLVYFPTQARWLADLESELFGFPHVRHDDQVDSISQVLAHCSMRTGYDSTMAWVG